MGLDNGLYFFMSFEGSSYWFESVNRGRAFLRELLKNHRVCRRLAELHARPVGLKMHLFSKLVPISSRRLLGKLELLRRFDIRGDLLPQR